MRDAVPGPLLKPILMLGIDLPAREHMAKIDSEVSGCPVRVGDLALIACQCLGIPRTATGLEI